VPTGGEGGEGGEGGGGGGGGGGGAAANTCPRYAAMSAIIASHVAVFWTYIGYSRSYMSVLPLVYAPGVVIAPVMRSGRFAPIRTPPDAEPACGSVRGSALWQSAHDAGNER